MITSIKSNESLINVKFSASQILILTLLIISIFISQYFDITAFLHKHHLFDKSGHFLGFLLLTAITHKLLKFDLTTVVMSMIVYSGLTEIGQWLLGYRSGQWLDFVANFIGCLSYALLFKVVHWFKRTQEQ
ncbi:VanZ family protein [Thalassotalea crassostreae]|uniref:VanZ family protein n=1 Tax=Thalassotalea crassostreae TaxID=1763536 RepID=UPI000837DB7D|nr:VanZ family protein [Thalassotalea crassostreae]